VDVVRRTLPIPGFDSAWIGQKWIQMSDIHAGPFVDDAYLFAEFSRIS